MTLLSRINSGKLRGRMPFAEVVMSNTEISAAVGDQVVAGKMRKIASTLYTTNMKDAPEAIIKRNTWRIVALYCPGAIITDRTGIENRPSSDGSVFVIHDRRTDVVLPGLRIRPRKGHAATAEDRTFIGGSAHGLSQSRAAGESGALACPFRRGSHAEPIRVGGIPGEDSSATGRARCP